MPDFAIFHHHDMILHDTGRGHPERPQRLQAVMESIKSADLANTDWRSAVLVDRAHLELAHEPGYIDAIAALDGRSALLDADTPVSPKSVRAAQLAAGAAVGAANAVIAGDVQSAFALVRPPGHHAGPARAMGFCLFNNIAVAAAAALRDHQLNRVLIIDWDVHHGNGTQEIFYERDDVLFISLHQHPLWPGTGALEELGEGNGEGYSVNLPLPAGTTNATCLEVFRSVITPIAREYEPELILVSAGFDAHENDPLGGMRITNAGFGAMCAITRDLARELCDGKLVLVLEGGYDIDGLRDSALACARVLADGQAEAPIGTPGDDIVQRFRTHFARHWPV